MKTLEPHIRRLLIDHDCVVVPGLGAFIAQYRAARVEEGCFMPPSRRVAFNPALAHEDGLLAASVSRATGCGYRRACRVVEEAVSAARRAMASGRSLEVAGVGSLTAQSSGELEFRPCEPSTIAALAYAGLPKLPLGAAGATAASAERRVIDTPVLPAAVQEPRRERDTDYIRVPRRWVRVAAASAAAVLVLGVLLTTPRLVNRSQVVTASLSTPVAGVSSRLHGAATAEPQALSATADFEALPADPEPQAFPAASEQQALPDDPEPQAPADTSDVQAASLAASIADPASFAADAGRADVDTLRLARQRRRAALASARVADDEEWCVVVASLNSMRRARRYISSTANPALQVLDQEGRYRVIVASAPTEDAAKALASLPEMQRRYPGAWVTRR